MQKLLKFEKWLPKVSAVSFYNTDCILVNLSKIFGDNYSHLFIVNSLHGFFHKFNLFNLKKRNLNEIYTIKFEIPTSGPFLKKNYMKVQDIFFKVQKKIPLDNCVFS